jgi:outer membrane protein assembly factor BamC
MHIRFLKRVLISTLLLVCTACGYIFGDEGVFRDRSEDYKTAPAPAPIKMPEGMDSAALREIYVIPPVEDKFLAQGEFEVPRPEPLVSGASGAEVVRIQKLGDKSWALIGVAPGQVWPQVRAFLSASGMQVARADATAGIMETGWLTLEGRSMASRFRFRMEQGVQRGTSELHVLQMNQAGNVNEWPAKSDDPAQAAEMLQAVAQFLADTAESPPVSMMAEQGISAGGKISLQEAPEGYSYIRLDLPYDRAWASLGRALEESTFEITDRDRSAGIYYVRLLGPQKDEEEGWLAWMWGDDEEQQLSGESFLVTMAPLPDKAVSIRLKPQDTSVAFDKKEEQGLLSLIKGNID